MTVRDYCERAIEMNQRQRRVLSGIRSCLIEKGAAPKMNLPDPDSKIERLVVENELLVRRMVALGEELLADA